MDLSNIINFPQDMTQLLMGGYNFVPPTTGKVLFVGSANGGKDVSGRGTPLEPLGTINYAIGKCQASAGDCVIAMPGHAETISGAAALNLSKIGVRVIGLGNRNNRPQITLATTATTIRFSAASCSLRNVVLLAGVDEIVTPIEIQAAYAELTAVDVVEVAAQQFIQFLKTTAAGTDMIMQFCTHHQATAPAANSLWIQLIGADRAKILNNRIQINTTNSASSSVIESDTTAPKDILIENNMIVQLGGASVVPINLLAGTTGFASNNRVASPKTAIAGSISLASCYGGENYANHTVNKNGLLEPGVDA